MSVEDRQRTIDALIASVPPLIRDAFGADSCVLASRVGADLLREVGIAAKLLPVRVAVYNPAMAELIGDDLDMLIREWPAGEDEAAHAAGARSVMIGWAYKGEDVSDRFVGHCVLMVQNPDGLIDLTLDQAARAEHDIHVEPTFLPMNRPTLRRFTAGTGSVAYRDEDRGAHMVYGIADDLWDVLRSSADVRLPTPSHRAVHAATLQTCRRAFRDRLASVAAAP